MTGRNSVAWRRAAAMGVEYLFEMPVSVPPGRLVVHNHVVPQPVLGLNGFRAWMAKTDAGRLEVCGCDWAPHLPEHYRVVR
jgi:hypothetical protein